MPRLPRAPAAWLVPLLVWFGVLWVLSSRPGSVQPALFPHFDKLLHFSYFFGGGFLTAGWISCLQPARAKWRKIVITATIAMAFAGISDEWHQLHTPGRSGGDPWDWLADLLGGAAGALTLRFAYLRMR